MLASLEPDANISSACYPLRPCQIDKGQLAQALLPSLTAVFIAEPVIQYHLHAIASFKQGRRGSR